MDDHTVVILFLSIVLTTSTVECSFSDVTLKIEPPDSQHTGVIAAFGDFNADKATDIFMLSQDGTSLFILEAKIDIREEGTRFKNKTLIPGKNGEASIISVVPGDFNSDSQMDVLLMRKAGETEVKVEIYVGRGETVVYFLTVNETFKDQPVVIDGDGDMAPDLFGETIDGERALWSFKANYTFKKYNDRPFPLWVPQSSAFLDLNGDMTPDICVVANENGAMKFEFWINKAGDLVYTHNISAPAALKVFGQASFVDLNGNHEINIVLPGCLDKDCKESAIYVWSNEEKTTEGVWHRLDVSFQNHGDTFTFPTATKPFDWLKLPIILRMGDFNLDGYPDAVAVLSDERNLTSFLFYNVGCGSGCQNFSRTFSIHFEQPLHKYLPSISTFFDLNEDGVLDILLTENKTGVPVIQAVQQDFSGDASFLKVMVVSGMCQKSCPEGHSPYGVNQAGPTARFESTTPTGTDQIGVATQLSQSAYFSLQLPFMLFGLGQTPNFVDELRVGIPYPLGKPLRSHLWSSIIPNSQIIVIPYPLDDPSSWKIELYVTPSRLVLLTGVSLLGTCACIAVIVGLLQWKERIEDKKEKLQEKQRFHFDAM